MSNPMEEKPGPMNAEEFRVWGKRMVDFAADYWEGLREREPLPKVKPGYIWDLVPGEAPQEPESMEDIFKDLEKTVVAPNTHWQHPHFFAYYPTATSYPAIAADILSGALSCIGFSWISSPSCTELEMVVMDWLAKALQLPDHFLNKAPGPGAGMIQCTASDSTLVAVLAARSRACKATKLDDSEASENTYFPMLVAYCSDQAHSSVERAGLLAAVKMRTLPTTAEDNYALRGATLKAAVEEDLKEGLIPFFVCGTVGATTCCAIDALPEVGAVCQQFGLWFHIDAAYAGSAAICPEYRPIINGVELADSFNFNCHKWMMVNFDCSAMWFKNSTEVGAAFHVDPLYLKHAHQDSTVPDYRHWQIPLGRRFRSLKLWFVLRAMGISGIQKHIRSMCELATEFERALLVDESFELFVPVTLGLVCFRLKGENGRSEKLLELLNADGRIHLVPSRVGEAYFLRLAICSALTNPEDVRFAASVLQELARKITSV